MENLEKVGDGVTVCSETQRYLRGGVAAVGDRVRIAPWALDAFEQQNGASLGTDTGWVQEIRADCLAIRVNSAVASLIACDSDSLTKIS